MPEEEKRAEENLPYDLISREKGAFRFRKHNRLRKRNDILEVIKTGRRCFTTDLVIYFIVKGNLSPKICIAVSARNRTGVQRNRVRRIVRETFRHLLPVLRPGLRLVVKVKDNLKDEGLLSLDKQLRGFLIKMGLISRDS